MWRCGSRFLSESPKRHPDLPPSSSDLAGLTGLGNDTDNPSFVCLVTKAITKYIHAPCMLGEAALELQSNKVHLRIWMGTLLASRISKGYRHCTKMKSSQHTCWQPCALGCCQCVSFGEMVNDRFQPPHRDLRPEKQLVASSMLRTIVLYIRAKRLRGQPP